MESMRRIRNMSIGSFFAGSHDSLHSLPEYKEEDFETISKLGMGFFSHVFLAKYQNIRFVKKVAKAEIEDSFGQLDNERSILRLTDHEHIVNMVAELPGNYLILLNISDSH